jgi:spermidine/putrescine transport system substrate-binding protein
MILCFAVLNFCFVANADDNDFDVSYYSKFQGQNISINVFNWGLYISDGEDDSYETVKEFENLTGIKVNYSTYATNEELYSKLKGGGAEYDIVIPSDYMIGRFIEENMIEKLDFNNIPNIKHIMDDFKNLQYDPAGEYSVPYMWGTVVLIYNTKYVTDPVDSWEILWNEKYKGKIIMFQNSRDSMFIALRKLGKSMNTTDEADLEAAAEELIKQKPLVQGYHMDEIFNKLGSNAAWLAPYYAGDAINMMADNPDLAAAYPKEGTNKFVDAICIPKGSKNKEAAEMFINFLCEPVVSAANSEYTEYCTPNKEGYELLDDEIKNNPITYPGDEILANTEVFINMPHNINKKIDELWTQILGSGNFLSFVSNTVLFIGIIVVLVAALVVVIIIRSKKKNVVY